MKEFDLYPPMQHWLELYLKDKYKSADEIIVVDAHSERLYKKKPLELTFKLMYLES